MSSSEDPSGTLVRTAILVNSAGLHARPSHAIVSIALEYDCELRIRLGDREVSGRSILEVMTLCAAKDSELELRAEGEGALELLDRLESLIATGFDELV